MPDQEIRDRDGSRQEGPSSDRDPVMERLRAAVRGIRYGEVRVVIQDGVVVQIERVERQRFR